MQKSTWFVIVLAVCLMAFVNAQPLQAQIPSTNRTISVTGDAEVKVAPDEVILILGVETSDKNLQTARRQNDDRIKRVIALTKEFGIDPKHVQTDQMSVNPRYKNGYYTDSDFLGYFVRKTVVITLKDISKFEDLYAAMLTAGANYVQGVQFRTTDLRKYRDQARAMAIQAAKEKATAMAGGLAQKIGEPQTIQENYSNWYSWYDARGGGSMTQNVTQNVSGGSIGEQETFAPGQISVSARVTVVFGLQ
ncbi:MAG: SIMPL domain-containing protein [Chloroflexi bacterium]|nr:SIMPL domain-containing protein [Chloroflexota bacterium]